MNSKNKPMKSTDATEVKPTNEANLISQKIDLVFKNASSAEQNIKNLVNSSTNPIDMANKMSRTLKAIELIQMTCYKYRVMFKDSPPAFIENKLNSDLRIIDRIEKTISGMMLSESTRHESKTVH